MSFPVFFWYPDAAGTLEILSLGEDLQDMLEAPRATVADAYTGDGIPYRVHQGTTQRVRILLDRFGDPGVSAIERSLIALQAHLFKGLPVGFSMGDGAAWARVVTGGMSRGDTEVGDDNAFTSWAASAALSAGDEVVIETAWPEAQTEIMVVDAVTPLPPTVGFTAGIVYTYAQTALVRHRDFYPVLVLPADQVGRPIVRSDHRRNWTLDVTLEYSVAMALSLWDDGPPDLKGTSGAGSSLQNLVRGGNP